MEHIIILAIIIFALILFATEWIRADFVAITISLILMILGYVTINEGFSGFSNPAVITVIAMFILSAGLVRTGIADYMADLIVKYGGKNPITLTLAVMLVVGSMSAFMNNIGAVAILLPAIFIISNNMNYPVNKLLLPLSFGSLLGGLITMIGTPPNLLISIMLEDHGYSGFKLFDFAPTGVLILIAGLIYMVFLGRHLIPARETEKELTKQFKLENYISELIIPEGSKYHNNTIKNSKISETLNITILMIKRYGDKGMENIEPFPDTVLKTNDHLIIEGDIGKLIKDVNPKDLEFTAIKKFTDKDLIAENIELSEIVISHDSYLIGRSIVENDIRKIYGVIVLAMKKGRKIFAGDFQHLPLEAGNVLLVKGTKSAITHLAQSPNFVVINRLEHETRLHKKAWLALLIMFLTIFTAALGILHISVAGMLGAIIMTLTGCVKLVDVYHNVEWKVIFLIAGMIPLGIAMDSNHIGTAEWLANNIVSIAGEIGPVFMMAALYLFTTILTQIMSNAATALLVGPIAIAISASFGLQPHPFVMAIAISASTSFLTPISHQSNMLVYGVGNFRFIDFVKVGGLLNIIILIISLIFIPIIWPFKPL